MPIVGKQNINLLALGGLNQVEITEIGQLINSKLDIIGVLMCSK